MAMYHGDPTEVRQHRESMRPNTPKITQRIRPAHLEFSFSVAQASSFSSKVGSLSEIPELPELPSHVSFRPALQQLQLHKQRKETAALRQLWHSFSNRRRHRRQDELKAKLLERSQLLKPASHPVSRPSADKTRKESSPEADPSSGGLAASDAAHCAGDAKRPQLHRLPAIAVSNGNAAAKLLPPRLPVKASPKSSRRISTLQGASDAATGSGKKFYRRGCGDISYHTAITRLPSRTYSPKFRALTQLWSSPLPQLMEEEMSTSLAAARPDPGQGAVSRDIQEWRDEIVKVVPSRPEFAQSLPSGKRLPRVRVARYPYKVLNTDPSCHFARSWTKVSDKDYVISPEWASEKNLLHPGVGSRSNTDAALVRKTAY